MIELQKGDIKKLDSILNEISGEIFFGIHWKGIEEKYPNFFNKIEPKNPIDLIDAEHKQREFERLSSFFIKYECGEVIESKPLEKSYLIIKKNPFTIQFKEQNGFENLYSELKEKKKRENTEFKLAESNIRANELNEKNSKRNLIFAFLNIILGIINVLLLI